MASLFRWMLLFAAALVLTALFEPPLMQYFAVKGWHERPDEIAGNLLNWIADIVGVSNFPWVAGTTLGLAIGSWGHWIASRFDKRKPSKAFLFTEVASLIENVAREWLEGLKDENGEIDFDRYNYKTDLRRKVLYAKLSSLGIALPDFSGLDRVSANVGHYSFMSSLAPYADQGLLAEAKVEAASVVKEVIAASQKH